MRWWICILLTALACDAPERSVIDASPVDMLAIDRGDMAPPDLDPPDLDPLDMGQPTDMAQPMDMAPSPDMGQPMDMAPDLASPDMVLDMALPIDAEPPPADMTPPDMTSPLDMGVDMAPLDMAPLDMAPLDMAPLDMAPLDMAPLDMAPLDMAPLDMALPDMDSPDLFANDAAVDMALAPRTPQAGDLVITEFMPDPHGRLADRFAQWVEVVNTTDQALDIDDCSVSVDAGRAPLLGVLDAQARVLVGNAADPQFNGGLALDGLFDAVLSVRGGTIVVRCGAVEIDRVVFERRPRWPVRQAFALNLDPARRTAAENDAPDAWCLAPDVYWRDADPALENFGSPGDANPPCTRPAAEARIDAPAVLVGQPGSQVRVEGLLRHPGITDRTARADPSALVIAQVGYGPIGSQPGDDWIWQLASVDPTWNAPPDAADWDRYQRLLTLPDRGAYALAWRFSVDAGRSWQLADRGVGSRDGFQAANAVRMQVDGIAWVRVAGEVIISEIFFHAPALQTQGQWIELHNPQAEALDLSGCVLVSARLERAPLDGIILDAGASLAIPRLIDPTVNGGIRAPVGFGFTLLANDTIALSCRFEIDRVRWDDAILSPPVGNAAIQLSATALDATANDDPTAWCAAEAIYDAASERRGTPGQANRECPPLQGYPPAQVERAFAEHCRGCHVDGVALGGLSLEPLAPNTFGVPAAQLPDMPLITPGDRQQSYLWHKLAGTHFELPADGVQMPPGAPFAAGVIERFGLYIDALPIDEP